MKKFFTTIAVSLLVLLILIGYSTNVSFQISQKIVRLHVIANSDTDYDQILKLKVRDALLEHSQSDFTKKADVAQNLDIYKSIAQSIVRENGYDYNVDVEYGKFKFPTKHYNNISLPAGSYDAVRVKLGKAEGKNWWCVLFPPLCFVDGTTNSDEASAKLQSMLDKDSYDLITAQSSGGNLPFEIKFKIVEMYGKISGRDKVYARGGKDN